MLKLIIFILVLFLIIAILRKPKLDLHSHWSFLIPGFKFSTKEFYQLLRNEMQSHDINYLTFQEVALKTGNVFSTERLYLRVKWNEYYYDVCFAPFGDGCFVSWWLINETSPVETFLSNIPMVGGFLAHAFFRKTYYKIDTASMFMTYSHNSVLAVIDGLTKNTAIRISDFERKPILKDIFAR